MWRRNVSHKSDLILMTGGKDTQLTVNKVAPRCKSNMHRCYCDTCARRAFPRSSRRRRRLTPFATYALCSRPFAATHSMLNWWRSDTTPTQNVDICPTGKACGIFSQFRALPNPYILS